MKYSKYEKQSKAICELFFLLNDNTNSNNNHNKNSNVLIPNGRTKNERWSLLPDIDFPGCRILFIEFLLNKKVVFFFLFMRLLSQFFSLKYSRILNFSLHNVYSKLCSNLKLVMFRDSEYNFD